jgi:sterol desaturase/sphingolipid hydroxylase (fatty acid hydroxylase superfamily)
MKRPTKPGTDAVDLTVVAVPGYFAAMGLEYWLQRKRLATGGTLTAGAYEKKDTLASLAMGSLSLLAPFVMPRLLRPITRGSGRFAKSLVGAAAGAAALTTVADVLVRQAERRAQAGELKRFNGASPVDDSQAPAPSTARKVASIGGVAAMAAGGVAVTTAWATATTPERLWERRLIGPLGNGTTAVAAAMVGWDFLYYWNHRFMHTSRYMWAVHEVHHSSERYNLSTALRQPVADVFGTSIPYGLLCLFGIPPSAVATARGINLLYQFWIHTEAIARIGRAEATFNSPSHHRVHHGTNRQYLDRNHGGILIVWDRMFGTFEPEVEHVAYGLTTNIDTFNPAGIAGHEYRDMARDIASSTGWTERLSYVFRGPGWAMRQRRLAA